MGSTASVLDNAGRTKHLLNRRFSQQGRQDSNLQPPVLESYPNRLTRAYPRI